MVIIVNTMRQELRRNRVMITKNISAIMIHVYAEIVKNAYLFLVYIIFLKVLFKFSKKLVG